MIPPDINVPQLERNANRIKPFVSLSELEKACTGDDVLTSLLSTVCDGALLYVESVCQMEQIRMKFGLSGDEQGENAAIEKVRGSRHDSFIDSVNALSRMFAKTGKDITWRYALGDDRSRFGRLALTLSFELVRKEKGHA